MTEETNNIENHSVGGSVAVGRDVTVGGRSTIRGNATFNRDVYISGWLNARNIRGAGKGLYETVEKLNSAYPNPENGWFALVGNTLPADIYRAWGGVWEATGQKGGEPVLELARLTELSESLENEVSARVDADEALKKAIELGFADGLLEDNKNTEDDEGYMFSASAVERTLINKINRKNPINNVGRNVDKLKSQLYKKLL